MFRGRVDGPIRSCDQCGQPLHVGAKGCPTCGAPVPPLPSPSRRALWAYVIAVVSLVVFVAACWGLFNYTYHNFSFTMTTSGPEDNVPFWTASHNESFPISSSISGTWVASPDAAGWFTSCGSGPTYGTSGGFSFQLPGLPQGNGGCGFAMESTSNISVTVSGTYSGWFW